MNFVSNAVTASAAEEKTPAEPKRRGHGKCFHDSLVHSVRVPTIGQIDLFEKLFVLDGNT